jgi:N utilization substance protein B
MQALYQADVSACSLKDVFDDIFARESYLKETVDFGKDLAHGAWEGRAASDKIISKLSKNWSIERMGRVVVSILRLALYELNVEKDTPASVVINEAVMLSKTFATDEAAKFVNGILGAYLKENEACLRGSPKK